MGDPRTEMFWLSTDIGNGQHSGFGDRLSTEKPFVSDRIEAGARKDGMEWERETAERGDAPDLTDD